MLYTPSPEITDVKSTSYQFPDVTGPRDAATAASYDGALFQVTLLCVQVLLVILWNSPPDPEEESTLYSLRRALVTVRLPTPETENFSRICFTGLLSTWRVVADPKFELRESALM